MQVKTKNNIDESIFKKNDIRGIAEKSLSPELYTKLGRAYSTLVLNRLTESGKPADSIWVSVGWDARLTSPEFAQALIKGLNDSGLNVVCLGLCPTPLAYFSEFIDNKLYNLPEMVGSLIVTASHNPAEYNGLKFTLNKATLKEDDILYIKELVKKEDFLRNNLSKGKTVSFDITNAYIKLLTGQFKNTGNKLKIVVDSGNATAGLIAPELYRNIGCEITELFSEPDGRFPNHHPDPLKEENLTFLKEKVLEVKADFGIAFDGDSDRIRIVDNNGNAMQGDQLLLILALDILSNNTESAEKIKIISEVKCSQVLYDEINKHGGQSIMWKTGHSFIKAKMKEENALLAGEMSGHIFFKDRYFGYDDAIYAGCRFIEIITKNKLNKPDIRISEILSRFKKTYASPEIRIECPDNIKFEIISKLQNRICEKLYLLGHNIKEIITIDGLRVIFECGFGLIRASNTEPAFTLRFEADNENNLRIIQSDMTEILKLEINLESMKK